MKLVNLILFLLFITVKISLGDSAVLEAWVQVTSENIQVSSLLERFKMFIALSHNFSFNKKNKLENNTITTPFLYHNDSFQANYDFSQNLLTIQSKFNLLENPTQEKISDVKISINYKFDHHPKRNILIADLYGNVPQSQIGEENRTKCKVKLKQQKKDDSYSSQSILETILSSIINFFEPIIVTFFHIIVNGVLGHVLTTAFEELYYGRLISP